MSRRAVAGLLATAVLVTTTACTQDDTRDGTAPGPASQPEGESGARPEERGPEEEALHALPGVAEVVVMPYSSSAPFAYLALVEMEAAATPEQAVDVLDLVGRDRGSTTLSLGPGAVEQLEGDDDGSAIGRATIRGAGGSREQRVQMVDALVTARDIFPPTASVAVSLPETDRSGLEARRPDLQLPALDVEVGSRDAEAILAPARELVDSGLLERLEEATVGTSSTGESSISTSGLLGLGGAGTPQGVNAQVLTAYERLARIRAPFSWLGRSDVYAAVYEDEDRPAARSIGTSLEFEVVAHPPDLGRAGRARAEQALWRAVLPALDALAVLPDRSGLSVTTGVALPYFANPVRDVEVHVDLASGAETGRGRSDAWSRRAEAYLREQGALR